MGEWRYPITALRRDIATLKSNSKVTINVSDLEHRLNVLEDDFEVNDKFLVLDKINNPRREYDKNLDHYIKFLKEENAEYRRYTQLVITAGYATYFGLWTISKDNLDQWFLKWTFLLLVVSAFSFIFLEVAKMGFDGFGLHAKNKALLAARMEDDLDRRLNYLASMDRYKNRFDLWISRIWIISYPVALLFGVSAIFLLAWGLGKSIFFGV